MELLNGALRCTSKLGMFGYCCPNRNQAKLVAWSRAKQMVSELIATGRVEANESELFIKFNHNGAKLQMFGADRPDSLRGTRFNDIVLDEVAGMQQAFWYDVVRPALADLEGWALFIGTPGGTPDLFSKLYETAVRKSSQGDPDWYAGLWTVYESDSLSDSEIAAIRGDLNENTFAREFLCSFEAAGDAQLISVGDVIEAVGRTYKPADLAHSPRILAVDPARYGSDSSAIVKRQGLGILDPIVLKDVDQMGLAARVAFEINDWRPDAVFIDAGMGVGVIDRLRQLGHSVVEVPFGSKALKSSKFVNRRSEMWYLMREWLKSGGSIPDDLRLRRELATPTYSFDAQGRVKLEGKDDIKKRLPDAGSPDVADALCLTFAAPVAATHFVSHDAWPRPGIPREAVTSRSERSREWNPYSREERSKRFR